VKNAQENGKDIRSIHDQNEPFRNWDSATFLGDDGSISRRQFPLATIAKATRSAGAPNDVARHH